MVFLHLLQDLLGLGLLHLWMLLHNLCVAQVTQADVNLSRVIVPQNANVHLILLVSLEAVLTLPFQESSIVEDTQTNKS